MIELVSDEARLDELRGEWQQLLEHSDASVFGAWAWQRSWYRRWKEGRRLFLLLSRDPGGRLLGILPLYLEQSRHPFGRSCRRLRFLGDERVGSDHLGPIVRRDAAAGVLSGWGRWLLAHRPEWDVLELMDVDAEAPWLPALLAPLRAAGLSFQEEPRCDCPFETFETGLDFERFLAKTKRAENYRRRRRWLERQPGYRIDRTEDGTQLEAALAIFLRLHRMRWGEQSAMTAEEVDAFHRETAPWLASAGHLRLYTMWVGGQAVASVYALRGNGTFSYFNAGYDPAWRDKSVGMVLVGATFQDAIAEGFREYDFLRGMEPYKQDWTSRVRRTIGARAWWRDGPGAWDTRARQLDRDARAALRSVLPPFVVNGLRRLRKTASASGIPASPR